MKTKNVEFQRVPIHEDLDKLKRITDQFIKFKPLLEDLRTKYDILEIGEFKNEVFKELIKAGPAKVELRYLKFLNKQLDNMNITSTAIRKDMLRNYLKPLNALKESLKALISFRPSVSSIFPDAALKVSSISFGNNSWTFYISDEDKKAILESECSTYLETESEKIGYEALCRLVDAYGDFIEATKDIRSPHFNGLISISNVVKDKALLGYNLPDKGERPILNSKMAKSLFYHSKNK